MTFLLAQLVASERMASDKTVQLQDDDSACMKCFEAQGLQRETHYICSNAADYEPTSQKRMRCLYLCFTCFEETRCRNDACRMA